MDRHAETSGVCGPALKDYIAGRCFTASPRLCLKDSCTEPWADTKHVRCLPLG